MSELHKRNAIEHGFTPHEWSYGRETRSCGVCGEREQAWDDEEYPINPCTSVSKRKWRPVGARPGIAGDHFGDFQVGEAIVVTYHLDGCSRVFRGEKIPTVRVSAYFGVVRQQNAGGTQPAEPARYSPVSEVNFERLGYDGEVIEEVSHTNGELFPYDYDDLERAESDVLSVVVDWQFTTWSMADFWNGSEDIPRV